MQLDVMANDIFVHTNEWGGQLAGMLSEERETPYAIPAEYPRGKYLLLFDPLDGSSNIDVNISIGTIFGVMRKEDPGIASQADFLRPGRELLAAGYTLYGSSTMLVICASKTSEVRVSKLSGRSSTVRISAW